VPTAITSRGPRFCWPTLPPEAEDVVLEVAEPANPADRYVLGALVRAALARLRHRALEAVTIIERASSTTPTT
jgi:hypothetical protein